MKDSKSITKKTTSPRASGGKRLATIILAAGKGTRMESSLAKVLHTVCDRPMLVYSIELAKDAGSEKIVAVIGHQADLIKKTVKYEGLVFAYQEEQLGTAHAVLQAKNELRDFEGSVLILCGDVPLLSLSTVKELLEKHISGNATITVLTAILDNPTGYGRVVKGKDGTVLKIKEERDASEEEKEIKEINTGIYCVDGKFLFDAIEKIGNKNAQKEYYLTDIFEIANIDNLKILSCTTKDPDEAMGINTIEELKKANRIMSERTGR
jgi:UDP-N-acetylglucosamine diphosphorylase/glucosamine-1-phosphate N-acetyltransferase